MQIQKVDVDENTVLIAFPGAPEWFVRQFAKLFEQSYHYRPLVTNADITDAQSLDQVQWEALVKGVEDNERDRQSRAREILQQAVGAPRFVRELVEERGEE